MEEPSSSSLTRKLREKRAVRVAGDKENRPPSLKGPGKEGLKKYGRPVPGIAQQKLVLVDRKTKKKEQKLPQVRPLKCIRETQLYDEHWIKKQERSFVKWLNFVLAPTDQYGNVLPTQGKSVPLQSALLFDETAPVASLTPTFLSQRRQLSRMRQAACRLYQTQPCTHVLSKLEIEIEAGRLVIRSDYSPHSDVGKRELLLQLILCYNPIWLKLGLEAIFGEQIMVDDDSALAQTLSLYVQSRLLKNSQIIDRYFHAAVPGHYGKGLDEAICQFILKKFLALVLLLDKAKLTRLIDHDPCLFSKESSIKSSRELLLSFCRGFLSSEGDLTRHLQYLGYSVSVVQNPMDEFDFTVTNLATDLQDGLRLVRLAEMLTSSWGLSSKVRIPPSTKSQKLYNVDLALKCLSEYVTLPAGANSQSIVEGHREKTLALLWSIIFHFNIKIRLNFQDLKEEITYLSTRKPHPIASLYYNPRRSSIEPNIFFQASELSVLLEWCRAVGRLYGVPINNFNSSFSDGRMFCYLIHHYQPGLLPLHLIANETTLSQKLMAEPSPPSLPLPVQEDFSHGWTASFSPTTGRDRNREMLLANEKQNFKLLAQKLQLLGGVPMMIHSKDMSDTLPDEKVVMSFLSFLCHRLMLLRKETRSAVVLQRSWRKIRQRHLKDNAATRIQAFFKGFITRNRYSQLRSAARYTQALWQAKKEAQHQREVFLAKRRAVIILQRAYRHHKARRENQAATLIQACYKGYAQRLAYLRMGKSAIILQSNVKAYLARKRYLELKQSTMKLQVYWRATLKCREERERYQGLRKAATFIQACYRRKWIREAFVKQRKAAVILQSNYRRYLSRSYYIKLTSSVNVIQSHWRATLLARKERGGYLQLKHAAITLQSHFRRWQVQQQLAIQHEAATLIQSHVRGYISRQHYCHLRQSTGIIQSHLRATLLARKAREYYLQLKKGAIIIQSYFRKWQLAIQHRAATLIQSMVRGYLSRTQYSLVRSSVSIIQSHWKATLLARQERINYLGLKQATIVIQSYFRRWQVQQQLAIEHEAATLIQSHVRGYAARQKYAMLKMKVILLQVLWRATLLARKGREDYLQKKRAAITIQSHVRRWQVEKEITIQHEAATLIQSHFRGFISRQHYHCLRQSTIIIQLHWRATLLARKVRSSYLKKKRAAITIQSHFRRWQVQQQLAIEHEAATLIQSHYRGYYTRQYYLAVKNSILVIQSYWRATLKARREREAYLNLKQAAIMIQSHVRRWQVQQQLAIQHEAATLIQSHIRCYTKRQYYCSIKSSVATIQTYWRATLLARKEREDYLQKKRATITIQSHFRRWQVEKEIAIQHKAAAVIQSHVRGYAARQTYAMLKTKVVLLQVLWRATLLARKEREDYLQKKRAAITIQSHFRRWQVQQQLAIEHEAATLIQSHYRGYYTRQYYLAVKNSILVIQLYWRATLKARREREAYLQLKQAAITIQSHFRRWQVEKEITIQHKAATLIQTHVRGYISRQHYCCLRQSTSIIQSHWRATLLARKARSSYLEKKRAAITLQSHFRRWRVQQQLAIQHEAATLIQSHYRSYYTRQYYCSIKSSVATIQTYWRATLLARKERDDYLQKKRAAIVIQSHIRRLQVQQQLAIQHEAATLIQSHYRGYYTRQYYLAVKNSILVIQSYWRATLKAREERESYLKLRHAIIKLQSHVRRHRVQSLIAEMHRAAIVIQSVFRRKMHRDHYLLLKRQVWVLQTYWRATLATRRERVAYLQLKCAAITLQSHFRRWQVQQQLAIQHEAATLIQSHVRGYVSRQYYCSLKSSVATIQTYWRATLLARKEREEYLQKKRAAITIQSHIRRWQVEKEITIQHEAATLIQSHFRSYISRQHYHCLRQSASIIQSHWRATLLARKARSSYLEKKRAAITLQSHFRRWQVQQQLAIENEAAALIQSHYRGYYTRQYYLAVKNSILMIQLYWRATLKARREKEAYLNLKQAAITIQSHVRRWQVEKKIAIQHKAATLIQSHVRGFISRQHYHCLRQSASIIQSHWRATLLARKARSSYLKNKRAAITLQSHFRRWQVQQQLAIENEAAALIQSHVRGYAARQKYAMLKMKVILLQVLWRATLLARKGREDYLQKKRAAITIQSHVRRWQVEKEITIQHEAATLIQSHFRGFISRQHYCCLKQSISIIQLHWRATLLARKARSSYLKKKRAAITIQSHIRRWQVQQQLTIQHTAATLIQSHYRGYYTRQYYLAVKNSILVIQLYWRATLKARRKREAYLNLKQAAITIQSHIRRWRVEKEITIQHEAATLIQSHVRGFISRQHYHCLRQSTSIIQLHWRATLLARKARSSYLKKKRAAIVIQSHIRRWQVQQQLAIQHEAATLIQSHIQCYITRQYYCSIKSSVATIQTYWRATLLARKERECFLILKAAVLLIQLYYRQWKRERAATLIQANYRAHLYSKQYTRLKESVLFLQSKWRGKLATREAVHHYRTTRASIIRVQSSIRRFIARQQYLSTKASAIILQSHVRRFLALRRYKTQRESAILIQRCYRSHLTVLEMRRIEKRREWAATVIQRRYRVYHKDWEEKRKERVRKAVICIQRHVRGFLAMLYIKKQQEAALKIQCYWRGYRVRRKIKRKAVHEARRRIENANRSQKTPLRVRLPLMLEALQKSRYLSTVVDILKVFELITNVSEHCSQVIVEGNALVMLYEYISTSNRSRATLEMVKVCLLILLNVIKWPSTQYAVLCDEKSLGGLIDFMQKIYVTQPDIMLLSCQLLQKYCQLHPHQSLQETSRRKLVSMQSVLQRKSKAGTAKLPDHTKCERHSSLSLLNAILQSLSSK